MQLTDKEENELSEFINRRFAEEVARGKPEWFYVSFVDGGRFLGGVIINAFGNSDALIQTIRLHLNPGGTMQMVVISPNDIPPDQYRYKLLTKDEVKRLVHM